MESTVHLQIVLRVLRSERPGPSKIMKIKIFDRKNRKLHFSKIVSRFDCSCPHAFRASGNFIFAVSQPSQPFENVPEAPKSDYQQGPGADSIENLDSHDFRGSKPLLVVALGSLWYDFIRLRWLKTSEKEVTRRAERLGTAAIDEGNSFGKMIFLIF